MSRTSELRQLLDSDEILVMPSPYNALSAKIMEQMGFKALLLGGQVLTVNLMALPDYGYLSLSEMATICRYFHGATSVPLFVDADTGYGNAVNVVHTVRELEACGASGLFIEDQVSPPRCGHIAGRELISTEEMAGKIRAACAAREDAGFVVCARTDARGVYGPDEAIRRANAYAAAGADMTFIDGPLTLDELERFAREVDSPYKMVNLGGAAKHRTTPRPPVEDLQSMGYDVVLFALNCTRAAVKGLWDYLADLRERGSAADMDFIESVKGYPFEEWYEYTGFAEIRQLEEAYLPAEDVERRYAHAQEGYYVPAQK